MKKLLLVVSFVMVYQWLAAQVIAGKVIDAATGAPIVSATVELTNRFTTTTNESGTFSFNKVKPGNYTLHITSIGYHSAEQAVAAGDKDISIKLQQYNLFMQPVEVKAVRAGDKAPFTKNNISKKDIEQQNLGQDLPFMLNQTPSVVVNSDAGNGVGYTAIRIRGSDATRINVTLNGIPYNDAESQGTFFVDLPDITSSVNNIQIQRGVGTSSNGGGAFGASINVSTNEVNTNPYAEINNSYGSFNTWKHTLKAGTGLINDHFTVDARLSKVSSDGYIDRATSDLKSFYVSGAYLSAKTTVRLNVFSGWEKTYQAWNGITEDDLKNNRRTVNYSGTERPGEPYANQTDNYQQDHFQLFINHQFNSKWTANTAFFYTRGKGYYEEYKADKTFAEYGLPNYAIGNDTLYSTNLIRQLWLKNDFYGQIISAHYTSNKHQLTIGGGWNRYDGKHYGEVTWAQAGFPDNYRWYDLKAYKTDVNAYAKYQVALTSKLTAFADLQYRRVLYNLDGFRDNPTLHIRNTYNFVNPKAGLTYTSGAYQVYASYALGRKEPNRDDFEAGKTEQPRPEKLHDFEAGIEKKNNLYSWGATLYYMLYKDQLVLTGKVNDVGAYTRTNVPDSYRMGIELQGSIRPAKWLQAAGNIAFSNNRVKNFTEYYDDYDNGGQKSIAHGNTDIAFSPAVTGAATISIFPLPNFTIALPAKYVSRQYLDNTSDKTRSLDPFYVQDARVSYTLRKVVFKETTFIFQVNNVFNKKYEPNGYTYSYQYGGSLVTENYYFPMAGTNVMAAINIKL
ncbi:MAG: TonB-dependent receptor [Chitinophagaceae bacterium]